MKTQFKYGDHQSVSTCCLRRSAFLALASALKPIREISSVASGSHAFHCWQVGPFTGIVMMKLPAGLAMLRCSFHPI